MKNAKTTIFGSIAVAAAFVATNPNLVLALIPPAYTKTAGSIIALIAGFLAFYHAQDAAPAAPNSDASAAPKPPIPLSLILCALIPIALLAGCANSPFASLLTGLHVAAPTPPPASTVETQAFTDLYNAVHAGTAATVADLTGPNAQNGSDVAQAAWIAAGENAGGALAGQLLTDYGGAAVAQLAQIVESQIDSGKFSTPALQQAAIQTAAAAIQNAIFSVPSAAPITTGTTAAMDPDNQVLLHLRVSAPLRELVTQR